MATKKTKSLPKVKAVKKVTKKVTALDKLKVENKDLLDQLKVVQTRADNQRQADTILIDRLRKERNEFRDGAFRATCSAARVRAAASFTAVSFLYKDAQIANLTAQIAVLNQQVAQFKAIAETNGAVLGRLLPGSVAAEMTKANGAGLGYPTFMPESSKSVKY